MHFRTDSVTLVFPDFLSASEGNCHYPTSPNIDPCPSEGKYHNQPESRPLLTPRAPFQNIFLSNWNTPQGSIHWERPRKNTRYQIWLASWTTNILFLWKPHITINLRPTIFCPRLSCDNPDSEGSGKLVGIRVRDSITIIFKLAHLRQTPYSLTTPHPHLLYTNIK